ncbi:MAG: threonine aldolase family protein [Actinomycetes bacterium]
MTIDLRSDTVTTPTDAMRAAMAAAPVGDDVYGEDPTVNELERRVAELLGHEAALFTPTGSMANQLGLRVLVAPGQEVLCDTDAHAVRAELGAAAALAGITSRTWSATNGRLDADVVTRMMRPDAGPYFVSTAAVVVENTHNFGGGTVQPLDQVQRLRETTSRAGVAMHLDGARVWNAHVASGVPLATYGRLFDTVSVCLSKGLGAPVGSVLASSRERIAQARVWRKRLGGGMRQVGILAAAGLHALDHHIDRMADDHARARRIADAIAEVAPGVVDPAAVETNIVVLELDDAAGLVQRAKDESVLVSQLDHRHARVVTHLDVDDDAVDRAAKVLSGALARRP